MRKKLLLLITLAMITVVSFAQEKQKVQETYSRSAVTVKLLDYSNRADRQLIKNEFLKNKLSEKFDNNNLKSVFLTTNIKGVTKDDDKIKEIIKKLKAEKAGNKIIAKWYNRQPDGTMNMDLIHKRGLYNAIDADVKTAESSKRGMAMIKDMGMKLLSKSYIVVIDYKAIVKINTKKRHGWATPLNVYLFRVKYNSDVEANLFDNMWIYSDDDEATKEAKKKKFDDYTFDIEYVATQRNPVPLTRTQPRGDSPLAKLTIQKPDSQLLKELVDKGYKRAFFLLEKNYEDFRVKTALYNDKPYQAKIGKKEGLKTDQRYFVYEYQLNEKTNKSVPKRKGVIRAKKVVNNKKIATGQSPVSTFYKICGGNLEKGMLMQQRSDWGISIQGRYGIGGMGGAGVKASYNVAPIIGITQLKLYGYFAVDAGSFENFILTPNTTQDFSFLRYGGGLAKGFYFGGRFSLEPFVGASLETATASDLTYGDILFHPKDKTPEDYVTANVLSLDVGADFGIHITYWLKAIAGVEFHSLLSNALDDDGNDWTKFLDPDPIAYDNMFDGRSGLTFNIGLHIEF